MILDLSVFGIWSRIMPSRWRFTTRAAPTVALRQFPNKGLVPLCSPVGRRGLFEARMGAWLPGWPPGSCEATGNSSGWMG